MDTQTEYSLTACKPQIGRLVRRSQNGEKIILTQHGTPAVVLVSVAKYEALEAAFVRFESHREDDEYRQKPEDQRKGRPKRIFTDGGLG